MKPKIAKFTYLSNSNSSVLHTRIRISSIIFGEKGNMKNRSPKHAQKLPALKSTRKSQTEIHPRIYYCIDRQSNLKASNSVWGGTPGKTARRTKKIANLNSLLKTEVKIPITLQLGGT